MKKLSNLWLVLLVVNIVTCYAADFDVGISITPVANKELPKRHKLTPRQKNDLRRKVAKRYDLPENWIKLMNQRQVYYLEMEERLGAQPTVFDYKHGDSNR